MPFWYPRQPEMRRRKIPCLLRTDPDCTGCGIDLWHSHYGESSIHRLSARRNNPRNRSKICWKRFRRNEALGIWITSVLGTRKLRIILAIQKSKGRLCQPIASRRANRHQLSGKGSLDRFNRFSRIRHLCGVMKLIQNIKRTFIALLSAFAPNRKRLEQRKFISMV